MPNVGGFWLLEGLVCGKRNLKYCVFIGLLLLIRVHCGLMATFLRVKQEASSPGVWLRRLLGFSGDLISRRSNRPHGLCCGLLCGLIGDTKWTY